MHKLLWTHCSIFKGMIQESKWLCCVIRNLYQYLFTWLRAICFLFHSLPPYRHQPDTVVVTVDFLYNSAIMLGFFEDLLIEILLKKIYLQYPKYLFFCRYLISHQSYIYSFIYICYNLFVRHSAPFLFEPIKNIMIHGKMPAWVFCASAWDI